MADGDVTGLAARLALDAFDAFDAAFRGLTRAAQRDIEARDWAAARQRASERQDLYERSLDEAAARLDARLGAPARERPLWGAAKQRFAALVAQRYDLDRAETYFNSVTRKMLSTVGIDREVEFFYLHPKSPARDLETAVHRRYAQEPDTVALVRALLQDLRPRAGFEDLERDAQLVANELDLHLWPVVRMEKRYVVDVVQAVFYRNREAYVVGRVVADGHVIPLILPLVEGPAGARVDSVLLHEAEASIVFSFAYSYFLVDVERYDALIEFLRSILPRAELSELYNSLGYNRHGKTEFYRDLHRFVHVSKEQFVAAPGLEGAVMIVFTLPSYSFVFKVVKDRPCFVRSARNTSKTISGVQVREQYRFVSHRDRAGRMVDTQEFENLRFRRKRFSDALLEEFRLAGRDNVLVEDEYVVVRHMYVQRRVLPLPMYFQQERDPEAIRRVLIDFGWFLKDLAASGVFPCDLFNIWNYGVTHWGRVVLFDYDDVLPIERVRFREKPAPQDEFEEFAPEENWIVAADEDFFIDELEHYSGIPRPLRATFKAVHGDLYTLRFWDTLVARLARGELFDVIPYDRSKRFRAQAQPV